MLGLEKNWKEWGKPQGPILGSQYCVDKQVAIPLKKPCVDLIQVNFIANRILNLGTSSYRIFIPLVFHFCCGTAMIPTQVHTVYCTCESLVFHSKSSGWTQPKFPQSVCNTLTTLPH